MDTEFQNVRSHKRKRRLSDSQAKLPRNVQTVIQNLFEKKFSYDATIACDYDLESLDEIKLYEEWVIKENIAMKNELNSLKNNLNDKDMLTWHDHTREVNLAGNIAPEIRSRLRPELCTQAWCKFYEIASRYVKVEKYESFFSVHLCEAPGAFITSLNHFLYTHDHSGSWQWLATTLNPYYEGNGITHMIDEDRFIRSSHGNWYFGEDGTGDLMSQVNLEGLKKRLSQHQINLVTADGSIDCQGDPAEQESVVSRLQHCEVLTALHILSPGGTVVVKMFTMFECKAISLMYLLNCVFEKVEVFKPCTSKGGNSEVYVIGLKYKGRESCNDLLRIMTPGFFGTTEPEGCLFSMEAIPRSFLDQHSKCIEFFKDCQMTSIQRNLDLLKVMSDDERSRLDMEKDYCVECFFNRNMVKPMAGYARIMNVLRGRRSAEGRKSEFAVKTKLEGKFHGSFHQRLELSTLPWQQKLKTFETYDDIACREDNSLWIHCPNSVMSETEICNLCISLGKQVQTINSSRFCDGFYLSATQDIIKNVKWLSLPCKIDEASVERISSRLRDTLEATVQYYHQMRKTTNERNKCIHNGAQTENIPTVESNGDKLSEHDSSANCSKILSNGENMEYESERLCKLCMDSVKSDSITAGSTGITFNQVGHSSDVLNKVCVQNTEVDDGVTVRLYSSISDTVNSRLELEQHTELLNVVLHILKNCKSGDYVVVEMGTCLSRYTAGLVYILYRCFNEVGFIHHQDNLLNRHMVCVGYLNCPIKLLQYLEQLDHVIKDSQSEAVLEIVPVLTLLDDSEFSTFLRISNVNLLQLFITTVVNREKTLSLGDKSEGT